MIEMAKNVIVTHKVSVTLNPPVITYKQSNATNF